MTDLPAGVTDADVEAAVDAAIACMFAPHELPVSHELRGKIRDTQIACLAAALAGRVVVPREPTRTMLMAPGEPYRGEIDLEKGLDLRRLAYRAMIAAAVDGGA
jgi:hypothetical protein